MAGVVHRLEALTTAGRTHHGGSHSPRRVSPQRLRVQDSRFPLGFLERFSSAAVNNTTHHSFASIPTGFDRPGVTLCSGQDVKIQLLTS